MIIVLGSLATIFILIRMISIPEEFVPNNGRGIGIWIALLAVDRRDRRRAAARERRALTDHWAAWLQ